MDGAAVTKTANALFPDVPMAAWARILLMWAIAPTIRAAGGLWVGGSATLADGELRFRPNGVNRATLSRDVSFALPLRDLHEVRVEPAFGTDIIVLSTGTGEQRIRCTGAKAFADTIEAARARNLA